jgi:hypothetical protein
MAVQPNWSRYLVSLADEVHSQATRVRDLIGNAHWLSDGHHKEYLLKGLLDRHLPGQMMASRGFVVSSRDDNLRSTEQDILVVDVSQEAPLFNQGGLVVAFPRTVRAAISVKTTMDRESAKDSVRGLNVLRTVCKDEVDPRAVWCGAYFFEVDDAVQKDPALVARYVQAAAARRPVRPPLQRCEHPHPAFPDMLCSARLLAYRIDHGHAIDDQATSPRQITGYDCGTLATAFFLASLLDHLARSRGLTDSDFGRFVDVAESQPVVGPRDLPLVSRSGPPRSPRSGRRKKSGRKRA